MNSTKSKSIDDRILHQALEARMLKAVEFANVAAELESVDVSADDYLVEKGYINEQQRALILAIVASEQDSPDETQVGFDNNSTQLDNFQSDSRDSSPEAMSSGVPTEKAPVEKQDSRYQWIERFAQGGLGAVWHAHDTTVDRAVALKEILPRGRKHAETVEHFLQEARITGRLQHPGIVPIYDIGTNADGSPYYIMRFIEGKNLHESILAHFDAGKSDKQERQASFRNLLNIFVQVCRTMSYAHDQRVIHRDLKPRNIMIGNYGETLVVDWGLAKSIESRESVTAGPKATCESARKSRTHKAKSRRVAGTPAYMAPEQARGEVEKMDARSDVYSLGTVLFEILTGMAPYFGSDSRSIIDEVLRGDFSEPKKMASSVPSALNSVCLKAMQYRQQDRYQSAGELADDVERFLNGDRVLAHPETRVELAQRVLSNNQKTTFAVVCGLAALSLVIGIAAFQINAARKAERASRLAAVSAREAEAFALEKETVAKRQAVANLRSALDAVDTWLLELSGDLEFYPGLSSKRTEFLNRAANYYSDLSASDGTDVSLQSEAARAAIRCGDTRQLLGEAKEASLMFDRAIHWFRGQVEVSPESVVDRRELANALIGRAIVAAQDVSQHPVATGALDEAEEILQTLAQHVDALAIQTARARASVARARLHKTKNDSAEAVKQFEVAREQLVDIVRTPDVPARYVALYHSTLFELMYLYLDSEQNQAALDIGREAIRSFDNSIVRMPTRPDFYEGRMTARILVGNAYEAMHEDAVALREYDAADNDYRELMQSLFGGEYQSENLAVANVNRARIMMRQGKTETAHEILGEARATLGHLIQLHGQQTRLLRGFASAVIGLVETNLALEDLAAAEIAWNDATLVMNHLRESDISLDELESLNELFIRVSDRLRKEVEINSGAPSASDAVKTE